VQKVDGLGEKMFSNTSPSSTYQLTTSGNPALSSTSISYMDELVKEYLIFRGSTSAFKAFENDIKQDKDRMFKPEKIVDQIFSYIHTYDLTALLDFWNYLDTKYFSQTVVKSANSILLSKKFELNILRYYLVNSVKNNRNDKATEFFDKQASSLQFQTDWKEWFCLPFVRNPEDNSQFAVYFSKTWLDTFSISLQNFFSIVFQSVQFPRLLHYDEDAYWNTVNSRIPNSSTAQDFYNQELTDEIQIVQHETTQSSGHTLLSRLKSFGAVNTKDKTTLMKTPSSSSGAVGQSVSNPTGQYSNIQGKVQAIKSPIEAFIEASKQTPAVVVPKTKVTKERVDSSGKYQNNGTVSDEFNSDSLRRLTICQDDQQANLKDNQPYTVLSHNKYIHDQDTSITHCKYSKNGQNLVSIDTDGSMKGIYFFFGFGLRASFKLFLFFSCLNSSLVG
jgi:hypothetical protein